MAIKVCRFFALFLLIFLFVDASLFAQRTIEPTVIQATAEDGASPDAVFGWMVHSHDYKTEFSDLIQTGVNPMDRELRYIDELIHGRNRFEGIDLKDVHFILKRYEIGDETAGTKLVELGRSSIDRASILMDPNTFLKCSNFAEGEKFTSDFSRMTYDEKIGNGKVLKMLLDAGWEVANAKNPNPKRAIYFVPPLYQKKTDDEHLPIGHEKSQIVFVRGRDGKPNRYFSDHSSGNWTSRPRINRAAEILNSRLSQWAYDSAVLLMENAAEGRPISESRVLPPLRIEWKSSTGDLLGSYEVKMTWGRFDLVKSIVDDLEFAAANPKQMQIMEFLNSHFLLTHRGVYDNLMAALKAQPQMRVRGAFDITFALLHDTYGLSPGISGFSVMRAGFASVLFPYADEFLDRAADLKIHMRLVPGEKWTDPEGAPVEIHLLHDKTNAIVFEDAVGRKWIKIYWGSQNASGHFANAERQDVMVVPFESRVGQVFLESIRAVANGEYSLPAVEALSMIGIAEFIGHSPFEIPRSSAQALQKALQSEDFTSIKLEFMNLARQETALKKKTALSEVEARISRLEAVYAELLSIRKAQGQTTGLNVQRFMGIALAAAFQNENPKKLRDLLVYSLNDLKDVSDKEALLQRLWKKLGVGRDLPPAVSKLFTLVSDTKDSENVRDSSSVANDHCAGYLRMVTKHVGTQSKLTRWTRRKS